MKLSDVNYAFDEAIEVEITSHTGESFTPKAVMNVLSWKSRHGSKTLIEMQREMMKMHQDKQEGDDIENKVKSIAINSLSKLVGGWSGFDSENGKPLKFTPENVALALSNQYILDIVDRAASDAGRFLKA